MSGRPSAAYTRAIADSGSANVPSPANRSAIVPAPSTAARTAARKAASPSAVG